MDLTKQFFKYVSQNIFGLLGTSCYILADTYFIAQAAGTDGVTLLNLCLPIYNFIFAIGSMIALGSATRYAIAKAQNDARGQRYFSNAILCAVLASIPWMLAGVFAPGALLRLMGGDAGIVTLGIPYARIFLLFTPFFMCNYIVSAFVRNDGDPSLAMVATLSGSLFNVVFDYIFMFPLGLGLAGAALATTIALYLSWLTSILYARRNYEGLQFPLLPHGYDKAQMAAILKVGVPLGLNNSLYSVGHVAVQAVYNMQGSVFVAGCSIAGRVTGIAGIAITSFSSAAVVFAGQNLGAGNYHRLQRGVVQITCAAGVVTLLIGLVATVFCRPLLGLFSSDPAVLDAAVRYTWWVLPFIWTYAVFNCMMSFVNGTGAVKYTTVVNLLILWAVRIPAAYILHALGYGTSSMACVSLSYAVGLVAMLGYFLTPEWGKLRRKAKELGDAVTAETEPTL